MSMSADCTDNCKDIAPPCPPSHCLHSEVIDGSWACQLLDRLLYPQHTALCLFSLPTGSLNRLEPLFCFSAGTLQPHTHSTERQRDRATERLSNQTGDKKRAAANRVRVYCRVLCTLFNLMRHLVGRGASTAQIKTTTTQQLQNVCSTCCTTPDPSPLYLACKLKSNTCCLIKRNTICDI